MKLQNELLGIVQRPLIRTQLHVDHRLPEVVPELVQIVLSHHLIRHADPAQPNTATQHVLLLQLAVVPVEIGDGVKKSVKLKRPLFVLKRGQRDPRLL
jgi:hypothetical protein